MGSRTFNTIVVLFWTGTMTWLIVAKIMPPPVGNPPDYRTMLSAEDAAEPVCWAVYNDNQLFGWAATKFVPRADGTSEIHSRVFFGRLPLAQMAQGFIGSAISEMLRKGDSLDMDSYSWLKVDAAGRLASFECMVRVASLVDAISIRGDVEDEWLTMTVQYGDGPWQPEKKYFPPGVLLADALSPQSRLPGLQLGQTWTEQVYSPLRPPTNPVEVLQARVERYEPVEWGHRDYDAFVVTYRGDTATETLPRSTLWVHNDGRVLKQEASIFNSKLQFVRLSRRQSKGLVDSLGDDWRRARPGAARWALRQLK